ncbi:hypothetical protein ES708_27374 [subsurface metagenome]
MAGNDAKDKYIEPPEDLLEPLEPFGEGHDKVEAQLANKTIRILEDQNGCLYIDPDAQHIGEFKSSTDILRIYSREIQALRKVVSLLMGLITNQLELMPPEPGGIALGEHYHKVIEYLQNASWELSLLTDPRLPKTPPG